MLRHLHIPQPPPPPAAAAYVRPKRSWSAGSLDGETLNLDVSQHVKKRCTASSAFPLPPDPDFPMADSCLGAGQLDPSQDADMGVGGCLWAQQHGRNRATADQAEPGPEDRAREENPTVKPSGDKKEQDEPVSVASRFRMGYKSGCERCRMKVPGHYAHF